MLLLSNPLFAGVDSKHTHTPVGAIVVIVLRRFADAPLTNYAKFAQQRRVTINFYRQQQFFVCWLAVAQMNGLTQSCSSLLRLIFNSQTTIVRTTYFGGIYVGRFVVAMYGSPGIVPATKRDISDGNLIIISHIVRRAAGNTFYAHVSGPLLPVRARTAFECNLIRGRRRR